MAFDIDGVVADTMRLFLSIASSDFGIETTRYEDIVDYDLRNCMEIQDDVLMAIIVKIMAGDFSTLLHPMKDAVRVLNLLNRHHSPTLFVTARPEKAHITRWLCDQLSVSPESIEVVATGSFEGKREVLQSRNIRYFVEDRLETCFHLAEAGIEPIVYRQPWNRRPHTFTEVGCWREIEALVV